MKAPHILFVDDDAGIRRLFTRVLRDDGLCIETATDGEDALEKLKYFRADIVLTDVIMPKMEGFRLLKEIQLRYPEIFVVIITAKGSVEDAVRAIKQGAYDYILKPFEFNRIREVIVKIIQHKMIQDAVATTDADIESGQPFEKIIGQDLKMFEVFRKIRDVARTDATVLITGETGTGKELVAEAIHFRSCRNNGPLVRVNCAALPETLIASELFGHEKGAFTGAANRKTGHFEAAHRGSIFLDEIGDIPIPTQLAMLRVLETGTLKRVGGTHPVQFDTRIICATNKDLMDAIRRKEFREDLFYRINVVAIDLPPLRERKQDIPLLAHYFREKWNTVNHRAVKGISDSAMEILLHYPWPGNIRELSNVIETASIFCKGQEILPAHLNPTVRSADSSGDFAITISSASLPDAESTIIQSVLEHKRWNLKQASRMLNIARGTLYSKIKKYGLRKPE